MSDAATLSGVGVHGGRHATVHLHRRPGPVAFRAGGREVPATLAAVRDGADTVPAITDRAYEKDVSDVRDLAEATVHAHVQKLAHERRVRWVDGRVHPVE